MLDNKQPSRVSRTGMFYLFIYTFYIILFLGISGQDEEVKLLKRYEYKHSFKGPHLVQADTTVPFWALHGGWLIILFAL